jgi:hypothetical protein
MRAETSRLSIAAKIRLAARIWVRFVWVRVNVRRSPLPELVGRLGKPRKTARRLPPWRLSGAVDRSLRIGRAKPTCLTNALVLYRLLREQGEPAELVLGTAPSGASRDAHAWVELGGVDVGPPPGRSGHDEMARFS